MASDRGLGRFAIASFALALLAGCQSTDLPGSAVGHYEGYLSTRQNGPARAAAPDHSDDWLISAEAANDGPAGLSLKAAAHDGSHSWSFSIRVKSPSEVVVSSTDASIAETALTRHRGTPCFTRGKAGKNQDQLCFDGSRIELEVQALSLVLDRAKEADIPKMETPARYTLEQLRDLARDQSFDSRIEFEKVVQAELAAKNATLNLLPHFSINTVLGIASMNILTILKSVGDLVPFLLPDRWYHARGAAFRSAAEYEAWLLMRADSMNVAEGLAYATRRDEAALQRLSANYLRVKQIRDEIVDRESSGLIQVGSSDDVNAVLNSIQQAQSLLKDNLQEEYAGLAHAAGFDNPEAILGVDRGETGERALDPLPQQDDLVQVAIHRSLELHQLDTLIEATKLSEGERYFNWLDPSGDSSGNIGFGYGDYLAIGKSQVRELQDKREQLQALLIEKAANTLTIGNEALESMRLAREASDIQNRRIERLTNNMRIGIAFVLSDLTNALQELARDDIQQVAAEHAYLVTLSRIDRLSFTGPYAELGNDKAPGLFAPTPSSPSGSSPTPSPRP